MEITRPDFDYSFRPAVYDIVAYDLEEEVSEEPNEMQVVEQEPLEQRSVWDDVPRVESVYLPPLEEGELEIVQIMLESVTQDVVSIRAKRCADGWQYRVEDEYETEYALAYKTSPEPLTLGQMIELIDGLDYVLSTLRYVYANPDNIWMTGEDLENAEDQIREYVYVSSPFYPDLTPYYTDVAENWLMTDWMNFYVEFLMHKGK